MESLIRNAQKHVSKKPKIKQKIGQANIIIIGAGGAGNNTIDRLMKIGIMGATCIGINTDQQHLDAIDADDKMLIGRNLTRGLGAGGQPEIGRAAAEESKNDLDNMLAIVPIMVSFISFSAFIIM